MRSPKFSQKKPALQRIFRRNTIKSLWKNKVRPRIRQDYIEDPVEFLDYHINITKVSVEIENEILGGGYHPSHPERILVEKSKGLCRQLVLPTVKDAIILQALSDAVWNDIKRASPTSRSFFEPERMFFRRSVDREPHFAVYGGVRAWLQFQKEIFDFTEIHDYIIVTDIANYFDFIGYNHLRNIISGWVNVDEATMDVLLFVLSGILWQPDYMPRVEVGLPQMNLDAPRVLAHCFLFELDQYIHEQVGDNFVRYMDDIDIGVSDEVTARNIVKHMDLLLQTRQVRLNAGKTKILKAADAYHHFFVRENRFLDHLSKFTNKKVSKKQNIDREIRVLTDFFHSRYRSGRFAEGNGGKVMKRCLSLAASWGGGFDPSIMYDLIRDYPDIRDVAFLYFSTHKKNDKYIPLILKLLTVHQPADDYCVVSAARRLVDVHIGDHDIIESFKSWFKNKSGTYGRFGIYSGVWFLGKYGDADEVAQFIFRNYTVWENEYRVGRAVAGIYPRIVDTKYESDFVSRVRGSGNSGANEVLDFLLSLRGGDTTYNGVRQFLFAVNKSKPLSITFPKWLMILTVLSNNTISDKEKSLLVKKHATSWADPVLKNTAMSAARSAKVISAFPP